jgi:hypothetical protein
MRLTMASQIVENIISTTTYVINELSYQISNTDDIVLKNDYKREQDVYLDIRKAVTEIQEKHKI